MAEIYTDSFPVPLGGNGQPFPSASMTLCILWVVPPVIYFLFDRYVRRRRGVVQGRNLELTSVTPPLNGRSISLEAIRTDAVDTGTPPGRVVLDPAPVEARCSSVLYSSLEFHVPGLESAKAIAGGLGKVTALIAKHHPGNIIMVHPMLCESGGLSFADVKVRDDSVEVTVDGRLETVEVWHHEHFPQGPDGPRVDVLLLGHELFQTRTKASIYPNPMTRRNVLRFWSLWNQAVGQLLVRHRPDIFHCPDFHTAVAPWYAVQRYPELRVLLVLHNAEYQGLITTDMVLGGRLDALAKIWNLPRQVVAEHLVAQGRFNMLKAAVDFLVERQGGVGACAVSENYAKECHNSLSLFWPLKKIAGLDNPMLEEERPQVAGSLAEQKREAKLHVQTNFGLVQNADARILVFLGRLVRQKGVDIIADVAPWILDTFQQAQLVVIGPPGDGFGAYAKHKLELLREQERFRGRLFARCEFLSVGPEVKFAADFCLMPSRDEPFGYVDIEFAWHGSCMIGAQAGGLGKVPGFYYVAQNRDNLGRLRSELQRAIKDAMSCPQRELNEMSERAMRTNFPLSQWQEKLNNHYRTLQAMATPAAARSPRRAVHTECEAAAQPEEFMTQELSEDELTQKVEALLVTHPRMNMKQILERIGHRVDQAREQEAGSSRVTQLLLKRLLGVQVVHILVSIAYISNSLVTVLSTIMSTQWAVRFDDDVGLPGPLSVLSPLFNAIGLPPAKARQALLFMAQSLGFAVGAPLWAALCKRFQPRRLLGANVLLRIPLLLAVAPVQPNLSRAVVLALLAGFVSSGALLFIVFNFMMSIVSDFAEIAVRMGTLEMGRYVVQWLILAYTFRVDPSSIQGTKEAPIPVQLTFAVLPLALVGLLLDLVPGVLLFYAPGPYRDDRFPGWDVGQIRKKRSFLLFAASDLLGALISFPASLYVVWWMLNGWSVEDLSWLCIFIGVACGAGMGLWAAMLHFFSRRGQSLIVPTVLLLAPPVILQVLVEAEVSTAAFYPKSNAAMIISVYTLMLEGVRLSTFWIARIKILKDRWRLLSYASALLSLMGAVQVLSPVLCQLAAKYMGRDLGSGLAAAEQWALVRAIEKVVIWPFPIALLQYLAQLLAAPWINEDMEVAIGASSEQRDGRAWDCLQRTKVFIVLLFGAAFLSTFAWISIGTHKATDTPTIRSPIWPCMADSLPQPSCKELGRWVGPGEAVYGNGHFGLNRFGQNTTAKANCFAKMEQVGGNAFALRAPPAPPECRALQCDGAPKPKRYGSGEGDGGWGFFSTNCQPTDVKVTAVHLFEWRWNDIARECGEYLGPAGFNVVQISPPAEHIRGTGWATRYQPVSYKLTSRSGLENEFVHMVQECTRNGVAVMVDAVVNHMASTFDATRHQCKGTECTGFGGTVFGSREFYGPCGAKGTSSDFTSCKVGVYRKDMFHHMIDDITSNCGWPPWTNDRFHCDMRSLPDIDTEKLEPQQMLLRYLFGLFEIGVTHVRVDAASNIFTASLNGFLNRIPWTYVVQEYYSPDLERNMQALELGHVTNFDYGFFMAQGGALLDHWDNGRREWVDSSDCFSKLLKLGLDPKPVPEPDKGLIFLANHDSQRERWQSDQPPSGLSRGYCSNSDSGQGNNKCSPIYKLGQQYNLAQLFMLAWPWGNNLRLLSSYPFSSFQQGPPLERDGDNGSLSLNVFTESDPAGAMPGRCKVTPDVSPVLEPWEFEDKVRPWVCEHRWQGVAGMARFRGAIANYTTQHVRERFDDRNGSLAYSVGSAAFVAMSRGYNWLTDHGPMNRMSLVNLTAGLPAGRYCNLAEVSVPGLEALLHCSPETQVEVDVNGTVVKGTLRSGGMVAIHAAFPAIADDGNRNQDYRDSGSVSEPGILTELLI